PDSELRARLRGQWSIAACRERVLHALQFCALVVHEALELKSVTVVVGHLRHQCSAIVELLEINLLRARGILSVRDGLQAEAQAGIDERWVGLDADDFCCRARG